MVELCHYIQVSIVVGVLALKLLLTSQPMSCFKKRKHQKKCPTSQTLKFFITKYEPQKPHTNTTKNPSTA